VRLLERISAGRKPVGEFVPPSMEAVRFGANPSTTFPASEIQELRWDEGEPPRMTVNFLGLTGPLGVLPLYYTELVMSRLRERDTSGLDFFDIFNHRMTALFYRAWRKHRFTVAHERDTRNAFSNYLLALIGMSTDGLQNRLAVPDESLIHYSGLLAPHPRSAMALKQLLEDYFDVPVEIEQFAGSWYPLDSQTQCSFEDEPSPSTQLGQGAIVGDEVWDHQSVARIRLGPLTLERYRDFLPGGAANEALRALTQFFSGNEIDFEVQLILAREDVPRCELGKAGATAPVLGLLSWVRSVPFERDAADTIFRLGK
jgi:type VI secretion system protein ImpH